MSGMFQALALIVGYFAMAAWCVIVVTLLVNALREAHRSREAARWNRHHVSVAVERIIKESQRV
jgi:hypothetical protein